VDFSWKQTSSLLNAWKIDCLVLFLDELGVTSKPKEHTLLKFYIYICKYELARTILVERDLDLKPQHYGNCNFS
jgi:hypothetical protein